MILSQISFNTANRNVYNSGTFSTYTRVQDDICQGTVFTTYLMEFCYNIQEKLSLDMMKGFWR